MIIVEYGLNSVKTQFVGALHLCLACDGPRHLLAEVYEIVNRRQKVLKIYAYFYNSSEHFIHDLMVYGIFSCHYKSDMSEVY